MAQVSRSRAALRIAGDDLDPAEVTRLLGCSPTLAQTKGQELVVPKTGRVRIARIGMWQLRAEGCEPEDLDRQIDEILGQLSDNVSVWNQLSEQFEIDLFVGLFLKEENEGCAISPESISKLGVRRIELQLDIYDGRE